MGETQHIISLLKRFFYNVLIDIALGLVRISIYSSIIVFVLFFYLKDILLVDVLGHALFGVFALGSIALL